jgi:translocation and assembly module TamA
VTFNQSILDTSLLNTRIPFKRGELFQLHQLLDLQTSLGEDPYFNRVEVNPRVEQANAALEVPIVVDLVPRPTQGYEAGLGYGTDNGPRGRASVDLRRLNRRGHYARAEVIGAFVEQSVSTEYNIPAFGHPKGVLSFVAGYAILNPTTSNSRSLRVGARLSRPRLGWRESFSLTYQRSTFEVGVDTGTSTLFIPGASWERTRSDSRIFPSSGLRLRLDLQGSREGFLARTSFFQAKASGKAIRSLGPRIRVLVRAEAGRTFTDAFRELPPTLRFFTGGDASVRGFGYLSLGPRITKLTIGGPNLVVGSLETDFRVMPRWAVAVFTDAGNAFDETLDLEQSIGAGIRWLSPVGLIRVDVAQPVTRTDATPRLHLSIGPDL